MAAGKDRGIGARFARTRGSQLAFQFRTHGGARAGAGRKRTSQFVAHATRPSQSRHAPVHVTLRVATGMPSLRNRKSFRVIRRALADTRLCLGFRLVEYSVQGNHLHLIGEAPSAPALSRGIQGMCIRIAKRLNAAHARHGQVFRDRYHARALKTPLEVKRALLYVINNYRRHCADSGLALPANEVDPCSSGLFFRGWTYPPHTRDPCADLPPGVVPASPYLLRRGWRRWGSLAIEDIPGARGIVLHTLLRVRLSTPPSFPRDSLDAP
jgi:REP element-mobilizing transposase RayT